MISILIPTRKRHHVLEKLVDNIISTSSNVNNFEILFKIDSDDQNTFDKINKLCEKYHNIRYIISPRPEFGHKQIYVMYNELARISTGKFLWIYNDDARLLTEGWDLKILGHYSETPSVIKCRFKDFNDRYLSEGSNIFPVVHRKLYEIQGSLGLHSSIDVQYEMLCSMLSSLEIYEPFIEIIHGEDNHPSQYLLDNMPPFDPRGVRSHEGEIRQFVNLIQSHGYHTQ